MIEELYKRAQDRAFEEAVVPAEDGDGRVVSYRAYEEARDRIYAELLEAENESGGNGVDLR